MKRLNTIIILLTLSLIACKNEPGLQENPKVKTSNTASTVNSSNLKEVITSAYAVKDSLGQIVKDTIRMTQSITYNSAGQEYSNIYYSLDGKKQWEDIYTYNADGHKNGSKYYEGGRHMITYKYELDAQGRRIAYEAFEPVSVVPLYKGYSKYNEDGTIRKDGGLTKGGTIQWNYEYLFDTQGEELGYVLIDPKSGIRYASSYRVLKRNKSGEWIERAIVENNTIQAIETRTFIYN